METRDEEMEERDCERKGWVVPSDDVCTAPVTT